MGKRARPLRVAYFPMHPADDRATDGFCTLPAGRLVSEGIEGRVFAPSSPGLKQRFYRGKRPGWKLTATIYWYLLVLPRRVFQLFAARGYDVVFVQRSMFRWSSPPVFEWLMRRVSRAPLVYHLDDGMWLEARRRWIEIRCRLADTVVTGNDLVAGFVEESGGNVTRIEYSIDVSSYPVKVHADHSPVVIGYTGIAPGDHLAPVMPALLAVLEETGARLMVVGGPSRPSLPQLEAHLDWMPWNHEDQFSWAREFDIGIMPLTDTELHRLKEPMKVKEYMAAGLPQVVSPVGHILNLISDGEQGFLAAGEDEWRQRLTELVLDPGLRARMGSKGREFVEQNFDLPRQMDQMAELFRRLA